MAFDPNKYGATPFDPTKYGATPIEEKGILPTIGNTIKGVGDFFLGNSQRVAQDIGTGIRNMQEQPILQKNEQMASKLEDEAYATQDMGQRASLLKNANSIRQSISNESGDIASSFTGDVNQNPLWRGVKSGFEIANVAELPAIVTGVVKNAPKVAGKVIEFAKEGGNILKKGVDMAKLVAKSPSYKSTGKWMEKEVAAGVGGETTTWGNIFKKGEETLFGKLKDGIKSGGEVFDTKNLREAFNKFMSEMGPSELNVPHTGPLPGPTAASADPVIDSLELFKIRKQFPKTFGEKTFFTNILEKFTGKAPSEADEIVAKHMRNVVSKELKRLVPGIEDPDKLYSFYKTMQGDVPTWIKTAVGLWVVDNVKNKVFKQAVPAVTNVVNAL